MPPNRSLATPPGIESVRSRRANARMRSASSFEATVRPECDMRRATRDLAVAAGGCGRTGCTPPARSSAKRRQYLLRHALELAFLVISNDPEQDSRRSGIDVSLYTLNALRGRTGRHPELEHVVAVIDRVVAVEKPLGLGKCPVAVFVDVDIVVDGNLEIGLQFVSQFARVFPDHRERCLNLFGRLKGSHPAVGKPRHPPVRLLSVPFLVQIGLAVTQMGIGC